MVAEWSSGTKAQNHDSLSSWRVAGSPAVRDPNGSGEHRQPLHFMEIVRLVLEQRGLYWIHYHAGITPF